MKSQGMCKILLIFLYSVFDAGSERNADSDRCSTCAWTKLPDHWNKFRYDCSNCNLKEIPMFTKDARKIHLSYNNITTIRNTSFLGMSDLREIYFDNNQLSFIEKDAFASLTDSLWMLVLFHNRLTASSLESLQFVTNVQWLNIGSNEYDDYPNSLANLTNIDTLMVDIFRGFKFDKKFEKLHKLKVLNFAPRNKTVQFTLDNDTFEGLRNSKIQNVSIDLPWQVKGRIGTDLFKPFRYLKSLFIDIKGGYDIKDTLRLLHGLRYRSLDFIYLGGNNRDVSRYHDLTVYDVRHLFTICVKILELTNSNIFHFPFSESLNTNFANCIQDLRYGANIQLLSFSVLFAVSNFPMLRYLDFSIISSLRKTSTLLEKSVLQKSHFNVTWNGLKNIEYLDVSSQDLSSFLSNIFHDPDQPLNVKIFFNISDVKIFKAADTGFDLCCRDVYNIMSITSLDMSGWNCKYLNPTFLQRQKELVFLNASNTKIGDLVNNLNLSIFRSLTKLQNVDISSNNIYKFRADFFNDQSYSLQHLNISSNRLKYVPDMLIHLKELRTVDLQNNDFVSFGERDKYIIDTLENTIFDFKGNIFECTCKHIDSLVWLKRTKNIRNNLICKDGRELLLILEDTTFRRFWLGCLSEFWLDFSVIVLFLVMVILLVVTAGYRNKSFVIYLYIKARRMIKQNDTEVSRNDYRYDVFVSYSHMDYDWVTGPLFHYLSRELSLEVCLHQKDFIPGEPIASEILRCVESSRKTVFVITQNFLASKWSMMEMDIARHHVFHHDNDTIIVILKEDIPVHEMPSSLRKIWWRIVCLKYPQNESQFEHEIFNKKLSDAF